MYVGYGTYDADTLPGARALAAVFAAAKWPVAVRPHPFGHGANVAYIDEAFAFWDAVQSP